MSTIKIDFTAIGNGSQGDVLVSFNDNSTTSVLSLTSKVGTSFPGFFSAMVDDGQTFSDTVQANNYVQAFNRDFRNYGGNNNLYASNSGGKVTISATIGTFTNFQSTSGFSTLDVINNTTQTTNLSFIVARSALVGNCDTIDYGAAVSGGTAPYTLKQGSAVLKSNWDGSTFGFSLPRGTVQNIKVEDSGSKTSSRTMIVPRKLKIGEFKERKTAYQTHSDVLIEKVATVEGTEPVEYSLDDVSATSGQFYKSSNSFPGVLSGQYRLFVKDKYGCEISKIITVSDFEDATASENPLYFKWMEGQSLILSETPEFTDSIKKNYFNTGSFNQRDLVLYPLIQNFSESDVVGGQFKSSYDFHIITLHGCDGSKLDLPSVMIQENLGATQKLDCGLFPINGKTGVYFDGGNEYDPGTENVIGPSDYNGSTPFWAEVGQLVFIGGIGGLYIESASFDSDRGGYFVVDTSILSQTSSTIEVTHNRHDYNVFEVYFPASNITNNSVLVVEKGLDSSGTVVGNPWIGERIKVSDTENMLLLEWSDDKNKGGIVFQSGISFKKRVNGEFVSVWDNESETFPGAETDYSLEQRTFMGFEILLEGLNTKEVTQMNIASGLDGFKCNNLLLIRKKAPDIKRLGKTNLWTWKCEFGFGDNKLAIKEDEIVLSISTGVVGGGTTGKTGVVDLSGVTLFKDQDGNLIKIGENLTKK